MRHHANEQHPPQTDMILCIFLYLYEKHYALKLPLHIFLFIQKNYALKLLEKLLILCAYFS